jgi:hypothetical protein
VKRLRGFRLTGARHAVARAATVAVAFEVEVEVFLSPLQHPFALSTGAAGVSKGYPNPPHAVAVAVASAFDLGPRVWSHVAGAEIG